MNLDYATKLTECLTRELRGKAKLSRADLRIELNHVNFWMSEIQRCVNLLRVVGESCTTGTRKELLEAAHKFLKSCFKHELMSEADFRSHSKCVGFQHKPGIRYCRQEDCENEVENSNGGRLCVHCSPSGQLCYMCRKPLPIIRFEAYQEGIIPELVCKSCSDNTNSPRYATHTFSGAPALMLGETNTEGPPEVSIATIRQPRAMSPYRPGKGTKKLLRRPKPTMAEKVPKAKVILTKPKGTFTNCPFCRAELLEKNLGKHAKKCRKQKR